MKKSGRAVDTFSMSGALPAIPDLHDAVLERITVDWSRKLVRIIVTAVPGGLVMISAKGFRAIDVPRREPWGASDFVNGVVVNELEDSGISIVVEMQSGDRIELICDRFAVTHPR